MLLDDFDYKKLLATAYQKLRQSGERTRLTNPTRGSIREECIVVYKERGKDNDQHILTAFFGNPGPNRTMLDLIEGSLAEDFRNLHYYMTGVNNSTSNKNLELLAWLIDFPHRPNRIDNYVILTDEEKFILGTGNTGETMPVKEVQEMGVIGESAEQSREPDVANDVEGEADAGEFMGSTLRDPEKEEQAEYDGGRKRGWLNRVPKWAKKGAVIMGIGAVCSGGYIIIAPPPQKKCMYWAGDHYEKVRCGEEANGRFIIPIEKDQFNIRRIMREDTITEQHIGKLFYIKHHNDIQYFTQGGKYPEDLTRDLQKLSRYIFEKDSLNRKFALNPKS